MNSFELNLSTKLIFGAGTVEKIKQIAPIYGEKVLLVTTGNDLDKVGIFSRVVSLIKEANVEVVLYKDVSPNPRTHDVDKGVRIFNDTNCDFVIGLGGGSAMDCAKSIALVAYNGGSINDYILDGKKSKDMIDSKYPCICITTTSGTGSEVTTFAVLVVPETQEKPGFGFSCLAPEVSIVDPMLTVTMPKSVTTSTGIDVFFHAMEAYLSKGSTPFSDMCALTGMRIVVANLNKVIDNPNNVEARSQMAWGSTLGGFSILQADGAIGIHGIGQVISGMTDIEHGKSLCTIAPAYLDYTWMGEIRRYAEVARILGADEKLSDEKAAERTGRLLKEFLLKFGLNYSLTDLSLKINNVDKIVNDAYRASEAAFSKTLKNITMDDVKNIIKESF